MDPEISVIIPTYYRNDFLPEAIESVVGQDYEPVELIVVDDSGEGHAKPVLSEYDDVVDKAIIKDQNGGWQAAYTTGIEASTGDFEQFLDDDDYFLEGKLTKTAAVLRENPDVGVSYCGAIRGNDGKFYPKPEVSGDILERALRFQTFPLWTGSMLIEREVLLDCLPLAGMGEDDDLDIELGDTDLKIELAQRTKVDYVDECLVFYRQGENELWTGKRKFRKILQNIRHQEELYDRYPEVREDLLAEWYERQGMNWLEDRPWSVRAIYCFMKATYYDRNSKIPKGLETMASLFGRPGVVTARRAHNMVK
jgi:glycosyltransferase involved in cell wall biosynthesis